MNKELFGVFGDRERFEAFRPAGAFDAVVEGAAVTMGVRDAALGMPTRSAVFEDAGGDGRCVLWGTCYPPNGETNGARWLYERYRRDGAAAFDDANGSYLAVVEADGRARVVTDVVRSWECFYADVDGTRVFGSDAAAVARCLPDPRVAVTPLNEFLHLGGVLNDRTLLDGLRRVPFDHALVRDGVRDLARYRHDPSGRDPGEPDHAGALAERLERAVERRAHLPGSQGVLLSAGYDSRVLLAGVPSVESGYTVGDPASAEVSTAAALAERYDADHRALAVDERYFALDADVVQYTNGVKESLHVHHGGYDDDIEATSIYHGLLFDTLLRGYFLPRATRSAFGLTLPSARLDADPDPVAHLTGVLGYLPASDDLFAATPHLAADSRESFLDATVGRAYEECARVSRSPHAAVERFGAQNVLSTPFRTHLADTHVEALVAADRELVDWHLRTPHERRTDRTYREALRRLDADVLDPRPPDRPHDSELLNQVEGFIRRTLPGVSAFDAPWPDRRALYDEHGLDARVLPERPDLHHLPPRLKLRINDLRVWLARATDGECSPERFLPRSDALPDA